MHLHRRGVLLGTLGLAAASRAALAVTEPTEDFRLVVYWTGMHVADATLAYAPGPAGITGSLDIKSRGIAALVTDYGGRMEAQIRDTDDGMLLPAGYSASFASRRYTRDIGITYDEAGQPTDIVLKKRGDAQTSPVPQEMWPHTVDPLTAILRIRRWVARDGQGELKVPVFDARTRYDINITRLPNGDGRRRIKLDIDPLAGNSKSSWLAQWERDDGRWVEIQGSDDARGVPLLMTTHGGGTTSSIELARDCSGGASCS